MCNDTVAAMQYCHYYSSTVMLQAVHPSAYKTPKDRMLHDDLNNTTTGPNLLSSSR
jgi:hypothetical protein